MRLPLASALALVLLISAATPGRILAGPGAKSEFPRFVSLRSGKANVRIGPGRRYPIAWVFVRRSLPVQVIGAFETWRRIRDWEGTEGWIHQSLLSSRRSVIVIDGPRALRRAPSGTSPLVARVERGVIGRPIECIDTWCRVEFQGMRGWIDRNTVWGIEGAAAKKAR